jgi:hypothetical protein
MKSKANELGLTCGGSKANTLDLTCGKLTYQFDFADEILTIDVIWHSVPVTRFSMRANVYDASKLADWLNKQVNRARLGYE